VAATNETEGLDRLIERVRRSEADAQMMDGQVREAQRTAEQTIATLSLLLSLLSAAREGAGQALVAQLVDDLMICADTPDLAVQIAGCEPHSIDPQMIRASAALLSGDADSVNRALGGSVTTH
jgi:hypothetical protein